MVLPLLLVSASMATSPVSVSLPDCNTLGPESCNIRVDCFPEWESPMGSTPSASKGGGAGIIGSPGRKFSGCAELDPDERSIRREDKKKCLAEAGVWKVLRGGELARCACPTLSDSPAGGLGVWVRGEGCFSEAQYCEAAGGIWSLSGQEQIGQCSLGGRVLNVGWDRKHRLIPSRCDPVAV